MTRSIIYTVADGQLTAMRPSAPENEDTMQRLVAEYPEIIADRDGTLLLIRREQSIGDGESDGRWSLDHLFVTREGVPVLVELKRASDTRLRREVVGQMLDYAANSTAYWKAGTIAAGFAATATEGGRDADQLLAEFLPEGADPDAFWQQVDANFAAGRIKLVFVADQIPRELARIVEFLNEQMKADVRAVELNWFEGRGIKAFTPRVIGETERAQAAKAGGSTALPAIGRDEWITRHLAQYGPDTLRATAAYVDLVDAAGGHAEVTTAQGSIIAVFDLPRTTLYPLALSRSGKGVVQFNLAYLKSRPAFADEAVRQQLYDRLTGIVGPLSTAKLNGFPSFSVLQLNEPGVAEGLRDFLADLAAKARDSMAAGAV
ncbi:hypothetical protein ACFOD9_12315 [Novosphingobium bradum]|uniref:DUF91 domain-containing protein n=1 Tax=Novosphingobium bradum TaxID=1737444 RepID=A0ABV7IQV6_9SPHN